MQTILIDIINEKALKLLKDLELLQLIRMRHDKAEKRQVNWAAYKGAMSKQPLSEIDSRLNELREEWE